jgi:hypothetical protein
MGLNQYFFPIATPTLLFVAPVGRMWRNMQAFSDRSSYLLALDPDSGEMLGQIPLPWRANGSPITYKAGGRQYIAYPRGWGGGAELVALAIPRTGEELPFHSVGRHDADHDQFYPAVAAFDAGDATRLAQLLGDNEGLINARGYLHEDSEPDYFRQATLLHHIAGNPPRSELQKNVVELTRILLQAGVDPNAETADSKSVLDLVIGADQPRWLQVKGEFVELLLEAPL